MQQCGTLHVRWVWFLRAERGKTTPKKISTYLAAAGKKPPIALPNNATA
jgi:hypothetical protein